MDTASAQSRIVHKPQHVHLVAWVRLLQVILVSAILYVDTVSIGRLGSRLRKPGETPGESLLKVRSGTDPTCYASRLLACRNVPALLTALCMSLNVLFLFYGRAETTLNISKRSSSLRSKFLLLTIHGMLYCIYCGIIVLERIERFLLCVTSNSLIAIYYIYRYAIIIANCSRDRVEPSSNPGGSEQVVNRLCRATVARSLIDDLTNVMKSFSIAGSSATDPKNISSSAGLGKLPPAVQQSKSVQVGMVCPDCHRYKLLYRRQGLIIIVILSSCLVSIIFNSSMYMPNM